MFGAGSNGFAAGAWSGQQPALQFPAVRGEGSRGPFASPSAGGSEPRSAPRGAGDGPPPHGHATSSGVAPTPTSMGMGMGGMQHMNPMVAAYHMGMGTHFPPGLAMPPFHAMLASGQLAPTAALQAGVSRAQAQAHAHAHAHFDQMERMGALQRQLAHHHAAAHRQSLHLHAHAQAQTHAQGRGPAVDADAHPGREARSGAMAQSRVLGDAGVSGGGAARPQLNRAAMAMLRDAAMGMGMVMGAPGPMGQAQPYSQAVASLLAGLARPVKVCRTCNKSHDHVHHLPITGAVRAVRLSDRKDCRVDICGGCYKWAKRHFAGGHRRCDGGTIRRNCQERLDVARENGLLLVRWDDTTASDDPAPDSTTAAVGTGDSGADADASGADVEDGEARPKSRASSTTSTSISADHGEAEASVDGRAEAPHPARRRMRAMKKAPRAPAGTSRPVHAPGAAEASVPPAVVTGGDVVDAEFCVSMMPSPANALLPSPSCASTNGVLTAVPSIPKVSVARSTKRRRPRADAAAARGKALSVSKPLPTDGGGKGAKRRRGTASAPGGDESGVGLLGVLAAVACNSPNAKSGPQAS